MREALALIEHRLREAAREGVTRHCDRADVVQRDRAAQVVGQADDVAGTADVDAIARLVVHVHVVDGGQVEEVVDAPGQPLQVVGRDHPRFGDVAPEGLDPIGRVGEPGAERVEVGS